MQKTDPNIYQFDQSPVLRWTVGRINKNMVLLFTRKAHTV